MENSGLAEERNSPELRRGRAGDLEGVVGVPGGTALAGPDAQGVRRQVGVHGGAALRAPPC